MSSQAISTSSSSSALVSAALAATAASSDADHTAPVTFHGDHGSDSMSSAASEGSISSSTATEMHTATAGTAKLFELRPVSPKATAVIAPAPKAEDGAPRVDVPLPKPEGSETSEAVALASAAAAVAGAAGASSPRGVVAPRSPGESSPARDSAGGFFSYISDFFSWLFECFCCCFSSRASSDEADSGASGASGSSAGIELRVVVPGADGAGAAAGAQPAGVDSVASVASRPAALSNPVQEQIEFAIAQQLEPFKGKKEIIPVKLTCVILFETQGAPVDKVCFERVVSKDSPIAEYEELFRSWLPSEEDSARVTGFKAAFVSVKENENDDGSKQLHADFQIYSYNPGAAGKPKHEHRFCPSAGDFEAAIAAHPEFSKDLSVKDDYRIDLPQEDKASAGSATAAEDAVSVEEEGDVAKA